MLHIWQFFFSIILSSFNNRVWWRTATMCLLKSNILLVELPDPSLILISFLQEQPENLHTWLLYIFLTIPALLSFCIWNYDFFQPFVALSLNISLLVLLNWPFPCLKKIFHSLKNVTIHSNQWELIVDGISLQL